MPSIPTPHAEDLPKFRRVYMELRQLIRDGQFQPGSKLPAEAEMPAMFHVSELTIRRALSELARDGLIVRRRGSGSYVASKRNPALISGRTLRLGLLACGPVTSSGLQDVGKVYPNMLRGVLKEWGVWESNPTWKTVRQDECTEATWVADDHNVVVETLGESLLADTGYPDLAEIKNRGFDGLVTVGIVDDDWIAGLLALGIPTVLADYSGEKFTRRADQVFFDPESGYREAVRYFAQQGLSRIFFLGATLYLPASPGPRPPRRGTLVEALANAPRRVDPDSYLRLSAYRREMETIGLHPKEEWIAFQSQQAELLLPLAQRWAGLPESERPQAVVCHGFAQAEFLERHFAGHGHALRAAGASVTQALRGACPIVAEGEELGAAAGALLVSRLQRASRPTLRVGVTMTFHPTAIQ